MDYLTTHTSLSPIRRGFAPGFVNYKKGCTRLAVAYAKDYQLLAHGRWFSPGTPASSTTKMGRHEIAEILLKVALNTKNQSIKSIRCTFCEISIEFYSTSTEAPFGQTKGFEKTIITNNYFYYYDIAIRGLINSP